MNKDITQKKENKEKLKALREERKEIIQKNKDRLKQQIKEVGLLKKELKNGPQTIPELTQATGIKSDKVLWYISGLKKYGEVIEGEETGSYFKYALVESPPKEE